MLFNVVLPEIKCINASDVSVELCLCGCRPTSPNEFHFTVWIIVLYCISLIEQVITLWVMSAIPFISFCVAKNHVGTEKRRETDEAFGEEDPCRRMDRMISCVQNEPDTIHTTERTQILRLTRHLHIRTTLVTVITMWFALFVGRK